MGKCDLSFGEENNNVNFSNVCDIVCAFELFDQPKARYIFIANLYNNTHATWVGGVFLNDRTKRRGNGQNEKLRLCMNFTMPILEWWSKLVD